MPGFGPAVANAFHHPDVKVLFRSLLFLKGAVGAIEELLAVRCDKQIDVAVLTGKGCRRRF